MSTPDITAAFCFLVRQRRLDLKLSQEKLAELAGIHPTHVGLVERGRRVPSLRVAQKIASALGSELSVFLRYAEAAARKR